MKVNLRRLNGAVHFLAENEEGNSVDIDGSQEIGGEGAGFRPMELLLASIGSCASMDVVPILAKQRQKLNDIRVEIDGTRRENATPKPFTSIDIRFTLYGEVDQDKAEKAVGLAVEKYCSVAESLDPGITVTHSVRVEK